MCILAKPTSWSFSFGGPGKTTEYFPAVEVYGTGEGGAEAEAGAEAEGGGAAGADADAETLDEATALDALPAEGAGAFLSPHATTASHKPAQRPNFFIRLPILAFYAASLHVRRRGIKAESRPIRRGAPELPPHALGAGPVNELTRLETATELKSRRNGLLERSRSCMGERSRDFGFASDERP